MREIKFRVWDKDLKRMHICGEDHHDSMGFSYQTNKAYYYNLQNGEGSNPDGGGTYDLMQYTGLKDKNGAETYEGDIVKVEATSMTFHIIQFEKGTFHFGFVRDSMCDYMEMEVIGNIHENPNLIEGSLA